MGCIVVAKNEIRACILVMIRIHHSGMMKACAYKLTEMQCGSVFKLQGSRNKP